MKELNKIIQENKFKLVCECGKELKWYEEGINGSEYYECECGRTFNIVRGYV